jgi:hypothetical protein
MIINKDKLKEYINNKYAESIHINEIKSISIDNVRFYKDQVSKDFKYYEVVEKNGFVELVMIHPIWSGWKVKTASEIPTIGIGTSTKEELIGTWAYRDNRSHHRFTLESYQDWLIDTRDKKLESIGIR